jgi:predicted enzyme related to lactoylglutathione lyase
MGLALASVVIDTGNALKAAQFWAAALGWTAASWSTEDEGAVDNPAGGVRLYFMRVPEPKSVKNRVHLDLAPDRSANAEIERLRGLGATLVAAHPGNTVLADPEGNELCVTSTPD